MACEDPAQSSALSPVYNAVSATHQAIKAAHPATLAALAASAAAVSAAYIMTRSDKYSLMEKPSQSKIDLNNQSVVIGGKPEHRGSWLSKSPDYTTAERVFTDCNNMFDLLLRGKKVSDNGPCLGARTGPNGEFEYISYQEVIDAAQQTGSGLLHKGIPAKNDSFIGIFCSNRIEWTVIDFACHGYSLCPVPVYDSLGQESIQYVLNNCEIRVVLVDTLARLNSVLAIKENVATLELIITVLDVPEDLRAQAVAKGVELLSFQELRDIGKQNLQEFSPAGPTDVFSICNTSGTSGFPKGAMLTHKAFVLMIESTALVMKESVTPSGGVEMGPQDVHLSYLPLAHNFERAIHGILLASGARIGYYSGDPLKLMEDLSVLRPTLFPSVPRLLNRVYDAVQTGIRGSKIKSMMYNWAMSSKMKDIQKGIVRNDTMWDKIVFGKIQAKLGGRVRLVITGSAPLAADVMNFLRCAMGCHVIEGYGQTECGAAMTVTLPGDASVGHVGPPLPGYQVKLVDVPDMGFYAKDNYGEVCTKSASTLNCYYKNEEKTAEALDEEGWLHTGDVGTWLPNGTLKIVDRKKHIFKLSQGEYIIPEKIETVYSGSQFVAQCFINGDSLKPCLMGTVVPDVQHLAKWAPGAGFPSDIVEFCKNEKAKQVVLKDLIERGKKGDLKGFEQVKDIILEPELFSVENELLTPTFKNKRNVLGNKYKEQFAELYEKNGY